MTTITTYVYTTTIITTTITTYVYTTIMPTSAYSGRNGGTAGASSATIIILVRSRSVLRALIRVLGVDLFTLC